MKKSYITAIDANKNMSKYLENNNTITPSISKDSSSIYAIDSSYAISNTTAEIFSEVMKLSESIENEAVQKQTFEFMKQLSYRLRIQNVAATSRRLGKLSAVQNEDGSCTIEWHFAKFHIGLTFEPCERESYYFLVSMDESINEIETKTRRINGELDILVNQIVRFVINNV